MELTNGNIDDLVPVAAFEYIDESDNEGHSGELWARLALSESTARQLVAQYQGWGCYLRQGINLVVDAFLQDADWASALMEVIESSGARVLLVGLHAPDDVLEERELRRGDRHPGLARRSRLWVHSHGIPYEIELHTDRQSTEDSVDALVVALLTMP